MTAPSDGVRALVQANKHFNKLFGIGMNKTGTTSLEQIFARLGYRNAPQLEGEILTVKQLRRGNFRPLIGYVQQYDTFQDIPFSAGVTYAQVDALFPGSLFILTKRDPDEWFQSLSRFYQDAVGCNSLAEIPIAEIDRGGAYAYPGYITEVMNFQLGMNINLDNFKQEVWENAVSRERLIAFYRRRNAQIRQYFSRRRADLLEIDLTREPDIGRILEFLSLPSSLNFPTPHRRPGEP